MGVTKILAARGTLRRRRSTGLLSTPYEVWPGVPYPLGATYDGHGVNFAVYLGERDRARALCVRRGGARERELARLKLVDVTQHVWHGYVPDLKPGALYGFRAQGAWAPQNGQRFNPNKLLVDPYARAISGKPGWEHPLTTLPPDPNGVEPFDNRDSGPGVPKSDRARRRLRLERRKKAQRHLAPHRHLRAAREGLHCAPPRHSPRAPRHVQGPRAPERPSSTSRRSA